MQRTVYAYMIHTPFSYIFPRVKICVLYTKDITHKEKKINFCFNFHSFKVKTEMCDKNAFWMLNDGITHILLIMITNDKRKILKGF